jgi:hypothetical protein
MKVNKVLAEKLRSVTTFAQLKTFLADEMDWPIRDFEIDELTFEYNPGELGIKPDLAARIKSIKRMRSLSVSQPWGIFFVEFENKNLPVEALRRILSHVAITKKKGVSKSTDVTWAMDDLLFISNYGSDNQRRISFAHFSEHSEKRLPTLKVIAWDDSDSRLHLDSVLTDLTTKLSWPESDLGIGDWQKQWSSAFKLSHGEVIKTAKDLSAMLASVARDIRQSIERVIQIESSDGPLSQLLKTFREHLINDLDSKSFADMYAQTVTYGLLSARMTQPKDVSLDDLTSHIRTSPFLRELMETFIRANGKVKRKNKIEIDFDELGISALVDLLDNSNLEAVMRNFGDLTRNEDPVVHFYEMFLKEYDSKEKIRRGVFYTPTPIVRFMVRQIDDELCTKFGLEDGLADVSTWAEVIAQNPELELPDKTLPNDFFVKILDPATGTGTFLVAVIDYIHERMMSKWRIEVHDPAVCRRLWNEYVPKFLLPRLFGFELLMAPYAIAHLKIGLKLFETGYTFGASDQAQVFLTNSLDTGIGFEGRLEGLEPALAREMISVNRVKTDTSFTVILGNPPYSNFSANLSAAMKEIVSIYRSIDGDPVRERNALQLERNINDDYLKFLAQGQRILSNTGCGVIAFITNNSFISAQTLRGVRAELLRQFSDITVVDLGGSAELRAGSSLAMVDENVFDISQGVSILIGSVFSKKKLRADSVNYCRVYGSRSEKYQYLNGEQFRSDCIKVNSMSPDYFIFPRSENQNYMEMWSITDCLPIYSEGLKSGFDAALICMSPNDATTSFAELQDESVSNEKLREKYGLNAEKSGWANTLLSDRKKLQKIARSEDFKPVIIPYRPFDNRYGFPLRGIFKSISGVAGKYLVGEDSLCLVLTRQISGPTYASHFLVARGVPESRIFYTRKGTASFFPLQMAHNSSLFDEDVSLVGDSFQRCFELLFNLKWSELGEFLLGSPVPGDYVFGAYCYGVFHSPTYRKTFFDYLSTGFPRIPAPVDKIIASKFISFGDQLIRLHLGENIPVPVAHSRKVGKDFCVANTEFLADQIEVSDPAVTLSKVTFGPVKREVWEMEIGGYQVAHKWLKDRRGIVFTEKLQNEYADLLSILTRTLEIMEEIDVVIDTSILFGV